MKEKINKNKRVRFQKDILYKKPHLILNKDGKDIKDGAGAAQADTPHGIFFIFSIFVAQKNLWQKSIFVKKRQSCLWFKECYTDRLCQSLPHRNPDQGIWL